MKRSREFFVGLFSVAAMVCLIAVTISLQDIDFFTKSDRYYVAFKSVYKLERGASVLVHGVKEGTVNKIESIAGPNPVLITIKMSPKVKLYTDAIIAVSSPGVIGDTTLDIDSGGRATDAAVAPPEYQFTGADSVDITKMVGDLSVDLRDVAAELQKTLVSINSIISDKENQASTKALLKHLDSATAEADLTFKTLNDQLAPLITELRGTVARGNQFLDKTEKELHETAASVRSVAAKAGAVIDANDKPLNETITALRASALELERTLDAVQHGDGTVGRLIRDPRPFDDLRQAISSLNRALGGGQDSIMPKLAPTPRARPGSGATGATVP